MTPERKALLRALVMAADEHGNTIKEHLDWLTNDREFDDSLVLELAEKDVLAHFPPPMNFPAPLDEFEIKGRGLVRLTHAPKGATLGEIRAVNGKVVQLGGRPFQVRGVENYCLMDTAMAKKVGLLGDYV